MKRQPFRRFYTDYNLFCYTRFNPYIVVGVYDIISMLKMWIWKFQFMRTLIPFIHFVLKIFQNERCLSWNNLRLVELSPFQKIEQQSVENIYFLYAWKMHNGIMSIQISSRHFNPFRLTAKTHTKVSIMTTVFSHGDAVPRSVSLAKRKKK